MTAIATTTTTAAITVEHTDSDRLARRLALVTVCGPALGFAAAVVFAVRYGITGFDILLFVGFYFVTGMGIEGGFHRLFSHRSFRARGWVDTALAIAGSMAAQGPVLFWVATHRMHHAHADRDGDPHSPRPIGTDRWATLRGLWHGHVGWLFKVRRDGWAKHVKDLLRSRRLMVINKLYFVWVALGVVLPCAASALYYGTVRGAVAGLLYAGLARIFVLDQVTWGVNSLGHSWGARRYTTRDNSRNIAPMAGISIGGSWHNNHHAVPGSAFNHHRWWQVDLTGMFIWSLHRLRLVSDVHRPTRQQQQEGT
ncbi:MAG TPA: acyl-CoA desaturase [Candidatus Limnocylindrales bacterium]|nr:acyl-CoA desaturase [Candidatus Limnocylindrales bacterium]